MRAKEFLIEYKSEAAINAILTKFGDQITNKLVTDLKQPINTSLFGKEPDPKKLLDIILYFDRIVHNIGMEYYIVIRTSYAGSPHIPYLYQRRFQIVTGISPLGN